MCVHEETGLAIIWSLLEWTVTEKLPKLINRGGGFSPRRVFTGGCLLEGLYWRALFGGTYLEELIWRALIGEATQHLMEGICIRERDLFEQFITAEDC